jgi:hypothetical protein
MHELWTLLNDSLPSSVIGGIVAGMVVGLVLYYWTGNKSDKARLKHIKNLLKNDIELNLDTIHKIDEHLKSNNLASYPIANNPIKMSSIRVASSDAYVQVMETDMAILVSTLLESGNQFNEDYNYVKSNFESVGNRAHLAAITGQFPDLLSIVDAAMTSLNGELKKDTSPPKS